MPFMEHFAAPVLHAPILATVFAHIGAGFGAGGILGGFGAGGILGGFGAGGILGGGGHFGQTTFGALSFALQVHITSVPSAQADMHIELATHMSPVLQAATVGGPASGVGAGVGAEVSAPASSVPIEPPVAGSEIAPPVPGWPPESI